MSQKIYTFANLKGIHKSYSDLNPVFFYDLGGP